MKESTLPKGKGRRATIITKTRIYLDEELDAIRAEVDIGRRLITAGRLLEQTIELIGLYQASFYEVKILLELKTKAER